MNPMKRIGLVALLAVGVTLLAITSAQAKKPGSTVATVVQLTPPAVNPPEPEASGKVTTRVSWTDAVTATGEVTVSCRGLTPLQQYNVVFLVRHWLQWQDIFTEWYDYEWQTVEADRHGRLRTQSSYVARDVFGGSLSGTAIWVEGVETLGGTVVLVRQP